MLLSSNGDLRILYGRFQKAVLEWLRSFAPADYFGVEMLECNAVIDSLAAWWHNKPKTKNQSMYCCSGS